MAFTFFFRDLHVLEHVVKNVLRDTAGSKNIRVWDAGCAMGPEAYTIAILFAESMGSFAFRNLKIDATDYDKESGQFGDIVRQGVYPKESVERIPKEILEKYFEPFGTDNNFRIVQMIRERVTFHTHDLLSLKPIGDNFNLIVCKNVLLHFQQSERIEVLKMFYNSLAPSGYFASEQTQKMPSEFSALFTQVCSDAQLYKKVDKVAA